MIFLHISKGSEAPFLSILKLFIHTFLSFSEKGGNYYLPLNWENSGFRFINDINKEKNHGKKNESIEVVQ